MSRKQCRPPDPRPISRRDHGVPKGLSLFLSFPPTSLCRLFQSLSLSLSLSLSCVDYKFSRLPERNVTESPDPRRDCEIEKRCRRTRRADSRPHHGPTPPPTKSPSQGRSPTKLTSYEPGRPSERDPPFCCLSICGFFIFVSLLLGPVLLLLSLSLSLSLFLSVSLCSSVRQRVFLLVDLVPPRDYRLSLRCAVFIVWFFSPMLTPLHRFQLRFCSLADEEGRTKSVSRRSLCTPFSLFLSRFSRLFLPVNRSLRCTRADSYIYHALLSSSHLLGREAPCLAPYPLQPSSTLPRTRFVPYSSFSTGTAAVAIVAAAAAVRGWFSLYSSSVSRVNQLRKPSFFPLFCSVFRAFSRLESFAPHRTRRYGPSISMTLKSNSARRRHEFLHARGLIHRSRARNRAPEEKKQSKSISRVGFAWSIRFSIADIVARERERVASLVGWILLFPGQHSSSARSPDGFSGIHDDPSSFAPYTNASLVRSRPSSYVSCWLSGVVLEKPMDEFGPRYTLVIRARLRRIFPLCRLFVTFSFPWGWTRVRIWSFRFF